jgi:membrane protease YdiL (CAAX protease family)
MTMYATTDTTNVPLNRQRPKLLPAVGLALMIIAVEYFTRHFALFWLPVLGALRVNDMLLSGIGYLGLVWLTAPPAQRSLAALRRTVREIVSYIHDRQVLAAAALAIAAGWLILVDHLLWGGVELASAISPWRWETTVLQPAAPVLVVASLLLFNGVVVPFAEEWLWRGRIQPRVVGALGFVPGLLSTALLFSLKHAIIDASLGRLLMLTVFGVVMGVLASRRGWRASALAHALANTVATIVALVLNRGQL